MELLDLFACPECGSPDLRPVVDLTALAAPFDSTEGLRCASCEREYPTVDGVWVLWTDGLKDIQFSDLAGLESLESKVKRANLDIYDAVADSYGEHNDGARPYSDTVLFLRALAEARVVNKDPSARVLVDVGCATGNSLENGTSGFEFPIGVDISLANLRHVAAKGFPAVLADAAALPFRDAVVDLITIYSALHHLPDPAEFLGSAHRSLKTGGAVLIGCEPSEAALRHRGVGKLAWEGRKPVYRALSKVSKRFYLHADGETQERNDLAEFQRTHGGFSEGAIRSLLENAGFRGAEVFYDLDHSGSKRFRLPGWKMMVLKTLSLQNPLLLRNTANLSGVGVKV